MRRAVLRVTPLAVARVAPLVPPLIDAFSDPHPDGFMHTYGRVEER
jgi:hypothetical protein